MSKIKITRPKRIAMTTAILGSFAMLLSSCGYVSKSTLHTKSERSNHERSSSKRLPDVTIAVGERKLAYKNRVGFPPMFGGFIPSLIAEDAGVVKVELVHHGRGSDTYLTGLKTGKTDVFLINGLVDERSNRERMNKEVMYYQVHVIPFSQLDCHDG